MHLGRHDGSSKNTAADRDHAGEWALLVDVGTLNGSLGGTETQTDILVPSPVAGVLARSADLVVQEDVRLWRRILASIALFGGVAAVRGLVVPASGKRAPTGHCLTVSSCSQGVDGVHGTYVSSVAMVAVGWYCRSRSWRS